MADRIIQMRSLLRSRLESLGTPGTWVGVGSSRSAALLHLDWNGIGNKVVDCCFPVQQLMYVCLPCACSPLQSHITDQVRTTRAGILHHSRVICPCC
jgi:hypothetical protein